MALNDLFERIKNATTRTTTNVDNNTSGTANDGMNLSGVNNVAVSRGTPKSAPAPVASTDFNLAGTNNIRNAVGTPAVRNTQSVSTDFNLAGTNNIQNAGGVVAPRNNSFSEYTSPVQGNSNTGIEEAFTGIKNKVDNKINPLSRNSFNNDTDYEKYLVENKINLTSGDAFDYIKNKSKENDTTARDYALNMASVMKDKLSTEKYEKEFNSGRLSQNESDLVNQYSVIIDNNNNVVDAQIYDNDINLYNQTADAINKDYEKLNENYAKGKIDLNKYQTQYNSLVARAEENELLGERLRGYQFKQGFDYYNWAKENGKDVTDFEKLVGSLDDTYVERLGNLYSASVVDSMNILPQAIEILRTIGERNIEGGFDFTDENTMSSRMTNTANELRKYAMAGADGFEEWSLQAIGSLMPMINSMITGTVLGEIAGLSGQVLTKGVSAFTNIALGTQTAGQVTRQRIEEGNNIMSASLNGALHGTITGIVEGMDAGRVASIFTGEAGKFLLSTSLFNKTNMIEIAKFLNATGASEGAEEIIEYFADQVADRAQNLFTNSLDGKVNVETASAGELANQFAMAYAGALLMGAPTAVNVTIDSKRKYNGAIEARNYFTSVVESEISSVEEKQLASKCIDAINYDLGEYNATSVIGNAVELPSDFVETTASYNEIMNNLTNAIRQDVQQELATAQETLNRAEQLGQDFQQALYDKGFDVDSNEYLNLSSEQKTNVKETADYANQLGVRARFDSDANIKNVVRQELLSDGIPANEVENILNDTFVDGYYDNKTGSIVINTNSELGHLSTLIHEMTHGVESSKYYGELENFLKDNYGDVLKNNYSRGAKAYEALSADARKESVAKTVQDELLLGNEDFVNRLIKYNDSLAYRLYENIRAMVSSDIKTQLENKFEKAFRNAQNQKQIANESLQYSAGGTRGLYALMYSDDPDLQKYGNELSEKLDEAIRLDQEGLDTEWMIWEKTGWIKKADGLWRFQFYNGADETAVKLMSYLRRADGKTMSWLDNSIEMTDIIDENNILFKMYPELKNINISFYADNSRADTLGGYTPGEDLIMPSISFNLAKYRNSNGRLNLDFGNLDTTTEVFFHELQHAIQDIEGFEGGSNVVLGAREYAEQRRKDAKKESERLTNELKKTGLTERQINYAIGILRHYYMFTEDVRNELSEDQRRMIRELSEELYDTRTTDAPFDKAYEIYENNQGEIEAREEARRALYEKERSVAPRADGRLIPDFLKTGDIESASIRKDSDGREYVSIDNDILDGVPKKDWVQKVKSALGNSFSKPIQVDDQLVKINSKSRSELTNSDYTRWLKENEKTIYKDKLNATGNVDELLNTAINWNNEPPKHNRKDNIVSFERGEIRFEVGGRDYDAQIVVAETKSGAKEMYDITNITPTTIKKAEALSDDSITGSRRKSESTFSDNNISDNERIVKRRNYSLGEQAQLHKDRAVEEYGITDNPFLAGYILDDGNYLDFSEGQNTRTLDHRSIGYVFDDYNPMTDGMSKAMIRFMNEGNIRVHPESNGIDISEVVEPTQSQYNSIYNYFDMLTEDGFRVDMSNEDGRNVFSIEYPPMTSSRKVINDIKQYFEDGTIPEVNNPSNYFRFSLGSTDNEGRTLSKEQQDYFKDSKVKDENGNLMTMYHGTRGDFTVFDLAKGGESNSKAGIGFWFTPSKQGATNFANDAWYGDGEGKAMETYLNITNPYVYEEIDNTELLESIDKQTDEIADEIKSIKETTNYVMMDNIENRYYVNTLPNPVDKLIENGYKEEESKLYVEQYRRIKELQQLQKQLKQDYYNNRYTDPYEQFRTDVYKLAGQTADEANTGGIGMGLNNPKETLQKYRDGLIEQGYDGIIIKGTRYDSSVFGGNNDQYVAFFPNQIKNVDNLNPTENQDIRFSLDDKTTKEEPIDTQESVQNQYFDYGMNPVRNVDILRQTEAGPTSRYWNNLANSQYASEEEAQRIKTMVEKGLGAYETTSREKQEAQAKKLLKNMGMEDSFKYIMNADSVATIDVDNTLGRLLQSEMRQKGLEDTESFRELSARMQWRSTMQGKGLESFKGYRDSTPEGQIVTIRSEIERIQQGLNERYGDRANNIELNEDLIAQYLRARNDAERETIKEQIARDVAKQIPPSALEQLNSFRHLSMLFNPRTWIKNSLANKMFGYINEGTRVVRSVMESVLNIEGIEREAGIYNPFSNKDKALYKRFKTEYGTEFKNIDMKYSQIDAGNILLGTEFGEEVSRYRDQFTSKFLNKISEINAKMMSDAPGMSTAYAKSMVGYLKANGLDINTISEEQLQKAKDFAINEAKYATFNSYNKLASDIAKFSNDGSMARRIVVESFLPFKRTPLNLLRTGFRYTPVGLADSMTRQFAQLKSGKITANVWINNVAQGMTGSAIMLLGMLLSNMGIFRTKDDDPDRKQYLDQELGEQEYSLNWDGGSYTIDWVDPMIVPLAMGAELMKYVQKGEYTLDDAVNMVAGLADPMFETSMLSGISKNLSSYSQGTTQWWGKIAQNAVTNYVSQYIPSILGATARTIDDTRRSTYTDKGAIDRFIRTTRNKIPGLSQYNEPYINRSGEEEKNETLGMGAIGRAVLNFLSPGYYSSKKDYDDYDAEMYRLYDETGEIDSLPSNASKNLTFDGENYKFSPQQYTQWQRTRWQTEAEYVNQFMDSQAYKNLDDAERVATIKDIRSYAQKVAKKQFLESQGIEYNDDKQLNNAQGAIDNGIELYAYFDYLNNSGSKQAEKMAYLEKSGFSQKQKEYLWELSGYKKSYADVYASVFGETSNKSSKTKKSSKSSKKSSSSKVSVSGAGGASSASVGSSGASSIRGGTGRANMVSAPSTAVSPSESEFVNKYLSAYSSSINRRKDVSTGNASVVCPNCGSRVTPYNGRCPVCGNSL